MKNGIVFYEGPSQFNGEPVVGLATGLVRPSTNTKTGPMVQVYAISATHPLEAVHSGADAAICGNCIHRGRLVPNGQGGMRNVERTCYVTIIRAPHMVYKAYRDGLYEPVTPLIGQRMLAKRQVRLGAYGDVAAIPFEVVDTLVARASAVTGYTHAWRGHPEFARYCMASVETEEERIEAHALGFRTFRVRAHSDPTLHGEATCPASRELGEQRIRCSECMLCSGTQGTGRGDIAIRVHGTGARHFSTPIKLLEVA